MGQHRARRPLTATRQAIAQIRALFDGTPAEGWTEEAYLRFPVARRVPIYLGAMGPQMLRLAGAIADGVLPLLFPPEHFATVQSLVAEGAASAGRTLDDIDLAACIWVSISDDTAAAEAVLRDKIAYYGAGLSPLILERLGVTKDEFAPDRARHHDRARPRQSARARDGEDAPHRYRRHGG